MGNGQATFFESDEEAFAAGVAYNDRHNSWSTAIMLNMIRFIGTKKAKVNSKYPMNSGPILACTNCPTGWDRIKTGWEHVGQLWIDLLSITIPRVGIHISGDGSGMEQYAQKYAQLNGIEGQLDLSDDSNIFAVLNLMTTSNEFDAVGNIILVYNWNPLNQNYWTRAGGNGLERIPLWHEAYGYDGYYRNFFQDLESPFVYKYEKTSNGYEMVPYNKNILRKTN